MECITSVVELDSTSSRSGRTKARSKAVIRPSRSAEFDAFIDQVRDELNPSGILETLLAEQVAHAAWRLKASLDRKATTLHADDPASETDSPSKRRRPTASEQASRALKEAFESFELMLGRRTRASISASPIAEEVEPNEWPVVPTSEDFDPLEAYESDRDSEPSPDYRERLVFDFEVSDISPIVKGTWVTVGHVVSLIVDGWTWADILRSHPELTEDDIRVCVAYAMDEENAPR